MPLATANLAILALSMIGQIVPPHAPPSALPEYGRGASPAQKRALDQQILALKKRLNIREATLQAIATAIQQQNPSISTNDLVAAVTTQAGDVVKLTKLVKDLKIQLAGLNDPALRDPGLQALRLAQLAIDEGRLDDAEKALASLQYLRQSEGLAAQRAWLDAVRARAGVATLGQKFDEATDLLLAADADETALRMRSQQRSILLLLDAAAAQVQKGKLVGDRRSFLRAENILKRCEQESSLTGTQNIVLGDVYSLLGIVYYNLSELDGDQRYLRLSVEADRSTLAIFLELPYPYERAIARNNLANALRYLGERDDDEKSLEESVNLLKQVLIEFTRDKYPFEWSGANLNLGNALSELATRRNDSKLFSSAIDAYNNAANERTRDSYPIDWAEIQTSLGTLLRHLAILDHSLDTLNLSIDAYRNALQILTREQNPRNWANTQNSLAGSLRILGQWEGDAQPIRRAIAIYDEVLAEIKTERAPGMWASITLNRALAMAYLARLTNDYEMVLVAEREATRARDFAASLKQEATVRYGTQVLEEISRVKEGLISTSFLDVQQRGLKFSTFLAARLRERNQLSEQNALARHSARLTVHRSAKAPSVLCMTARN